MYNQKYHRISPWRTSQGISKPDQTDGWIQEQTKPKAREAAHAGKTRIVLLYMA